MERRFKIDYHGHELDVKSFYHAAGDGETPDIEITNVLYQGREILPILFEFKADLTKLGALCIEEHEKKNKKNR